MEIISARAPRRTRQDGIELYVTFKDIGEVPFHAHQSDPETHGRELYARAMQGEFGPVAPYIAPVVPLNVAKLAKQAEIRDEADLFLQMLATEYGAMEKLTWDQQAQEADALIADPAAAAPLVRAIATSRGMAPLEMAQRIVANRAQWVALSGAVVGRRLAYQDAIDAAQTVEAVAAIVPVFSL